MRVNRWQGPFATYRAGGVVVPACELTGHRHERAAAVGDSGGDVPMLAAVGHPFFVGAHLPAEIAHAVHAPDADLREIAQRILAR